MDDSVKIKLAALFGFLFLVFIGYKVLFSGVDLDIDENTGCPTNKESIKDHTMILIDASTQLKSYQQDMLKQYLGSLTKYDMLEPNEMVSIFILNKKPRAIEPIFQKCYPNIDKEAINLEILKEEYLEPFIDEINDISSKDFYNKESKSDSPIMEWIREMLERPDFQTKNQRMIIFSDMIENNTNLFSMYISKKWFKNNSDYQYWINDSKVSEYFNSIIYEVGENFNLAILQLKQDEDRNHPSSKIIKNFWIDFLNDKNLLIDFSPSCMKNKFKNCWEIK